MRTALSKGIHVKLRGIEFGSVFNASGARNFFGLDAYWFHGLWNGLLLPAEWVGARCSLRYEGCTFVSKTTTLHARKGNMPLRSGTTIPKSLVPDCIIPKTFHGVVLNKVGLSGPGAEALLAKGYWQERVEPFVISFMSIAKTEEERAEEAVGFAKLLADEIDQFCAPIALEINFSCPNVGHEQGHLVGEVERVLRIFAGYLPQVPLIPKFNVQLDPERAKEIARIAMCDAITVSNTIPWGAYPDRIDWEKYFGSMTSPLKDLGGKDSGGGGLSGTPLLPFLIEWLAKAKHGMSKPIIACGGILSPRDARSVASLGASAIQIGSISILRPWRVQPTIDEGNRVLG